MNDSHVVNSYCLLLSFIGFNTVHSHCVCVCVGPLIDNKAEANYTTGSKKSFAHVINTFNT